MLKHTYKKILVPSPPLSIPLLLIVRKKIAVDILNLETTERTKAEHV